MSWGVGSRVLAMVARAVGWRPLDRLRELGLDESHLDDLSLEDARELGARRQFVLNLSGLKSLTPEIAEALAECVGELRLDGLTRLSPKVAAALAKHAGWLYLNGLTTLSVEAARVLAMHEGRLSLDGLTQLSAQAAEALRANSRIHLPRRFDICPSCGRLKSGKPS